MEARLTATVEAAPALVWSLFTDVERWPALTKSMRAVRRLDDGPLSVGSEAVVEQPGLPRARWRVTALEPGRSFVWETSSAGVTTIGGHLVEADGNGVTITLTLHQHGPLARVAALVVGRRARRYLAMELDGFRRAAEDAASRGSQPGS